MLPASVMSCLGSLGGPFRRGRSGWVRALAGGSLAVAVVLVAVASLALAATNNISTVAGTGTNGYNGDGIAATSAQLNFPTGVTATSDGGYYIADQVNHRVRRVDASGNISTAAGAGTAGFTDGAAATAQFNAPSGVGVLPDGSLLVADANNNAVRRVANGSVTTDAGTGGACNPAGSVCGDGAAATSAQLRFPFDIAPVTQTTYLVADEDDHKIRRVSNGIISTIAGDGTASYGGDNGTATSAQLNKPSGVAITIDGAVLIADQFNNRIRRVSATTGGTITTVAGTGTPGYNGDGIQASTAQLNHPTHVTALPDGGFLIADKDNHRVRHVAADGTISTVAGTGTAGYNSDGIQAATAQLNTPTGVAFTVDNDYLIADAFNQRIRRVDAGDPNLPPPAAHPNLPPPAALVPVFAKRVNVSVVRGRVTVLVPGTRRFVALRGLRQIAVGSYLNTARGTVRLTSATSKGAVQTGDFNGGTFKVLQNRRLGGLTDLNLSGGSFRSCRRTARRAVSARARTVRRLHGHAKGRFRTRGRYSAATVRGTTWTVSDRCDGTLTSVSSGIVAVNDFRRHRTINIRAHHSYLARAH
jgi:hypothetical protein